MSPAAAIFTRSSPRRLAASTLVGAFIWIPLPPGGYGERMEPAMEASLKKAAAALREAEIPFLLAGSLAIWARGGPESRHDLDFVLRRDDAERALEVLEAAGMNVE